MKKEYPNPPTHQNVNKANSECTDSMNMNPYSYTEEIKHQNKRVNITLEFPYTVDPKDADRFEHMLKEVYLNKLKKGLDGRAYHAVYSSPKLKTEGETDHE